MRMIVFEPAYARVAAEMAPFLDRLEVIQVGADARIRFRGEVIEPEAAQPVIGWADMGATQERGSFDVLIDAVVASRSLRWVHTNAAGVESPIWRKVTANGAMLTTGHGQAISIAEYVLGEVLAHFQRLAERRAEQAARRWKRVPFREVMGSHWVIIGFGAIGEAVAERAKGFGAEITAVRRSGAPHPLATRVAGLADLPALLPEADVVVMAAPINPATAGIVDERFLGAMKAGSVFVNVGRGGQVDEAALLAALDAGRPAHAILDVFRQEPLPESSPLWSHPKIALNPHASAFGSGQRRRNDLNFVENLRRFLSEEPLLYAADPRDMAPTG